MKKQYKALMLDLDGTTFPNRKNGGPSERVKQAITKAQEKLAVCIVTGRSYELAKKTIETLNLSDLAVLLNGSQIIDCKTRERIYERPLIKDDATFILQTLTKKHIDIRIDEADIRLPHESSYQQKTIFNILAVDISEKEANEINKILSARESIATHKILSWTPNKICLDISHVQATKQHGIFEVAKQLQIESHEIIGIGDGPNDFPMLMACGLKVAMGNAVDDLKAIADYVAPTVDEDGVARVIEKFVL